MINTYKVYVAASFAYEDKEKTKARQKKIEEVVERLKKVLAKTSVDKYEWYLPHKLKIENAWDISLEEWSQKVYEHDLAALNDADIVIFLSFGKENNAGSAWEVGYIVGRNSHNDVIENDYGYYTKEYSTPIICIKMTDESESLMISQSVTAIIKEEEIDSYDWVYLPHYRTKMDKIS